MDKEYLDLALKALIKSKSILKKKKPKKISTHKKEIKINLDKLLSREIIKILKRSKIDIISEENSLKTNDKIISKKKDFWVIDPLDGSLNYLRKIPNSSICISLVKDFKIIISYIYDIFNDNIYLAYRNKIYKNRKEIKIRRKFIQRKIGVLATGFPHKYDFKKPHINFNNFQKVRMIGCASLSLLGCAFGRYDWYNEKNIMIWDIIAGVHFNLINKCKIKKFKINKICQEVSLGYCY